MISNYSIKRVKSKLAMQSVKIIAKSQQAFYSYKAEAMPEGESIQSFCLKNKVPYNLFHKWYKDTHHQIVPVHVEGHPEADSDSPTEAPSSPIPESKTDTESGSVRIMIDIRMTNGMRIQQRNLTYMIKNMISKLEGLCRIIEAPQARSGALDRSLFRYEFHGKIDVA